MRAKEFLPGELSPLSVGPEKFKFARAVGPNGQPLKRAQMMSVNKTDDVSMMSANSIKVGAAIKDKLAQRPTFGR